jgi:hypothetical protein
MIRKISQRVRKVLLAGTAMTIGLMAWHATHSIKPYEDLTEPELDYRPVVDRSTGAYLTVDRLVSLDDPAVTVHVRLHAKLKSPLNVRLVLLDDRDRRLFAFVSYRFTKPSLSPTDSKCDIRFKERSAPWYVPWRTTPYTTWHLVLEGTTSSGGTMRTRFDVQRSPTKSV